MRKTAYASQKEISASLVSEHKPSAICQTCFRPIYNEYVVQCTRCHGFIQCLQCFSVGAEKGKHIREHPFIVVKTDLPEILSKGWPANEEIRLLRAVEESGLGNWRDISVDLSTRTPEECENHFFSTYFKTQISPKPDQIIKEDPPTPPPWPDEEAKPIESHPSDGAEINMRKIGHYEKQTPAEYNGYMPMRGEFETELYDNAEDIINGINFEELQTKYTSQHEIEEEFEHHLTYLHAYNNIIEEREYRHDVIKDFGLLEGPFVGFKKNTTPTEIEHEQTLLTLAPFVKYQNLKKIVDSIDRKDQLLQIIHQKEYWQQIGIDNEEQGLAFNKLYEMFQKSSEVNKQNIMQWNSLIDKVTATTEDTDSEYLKMLTAKEIELCNEHCLHPKNYIMVKDMILREFSIRGSLSLSDVIGFSPTDEAILTSVYNYMKECGWIT